MLPDQWYPVHLYLISVSRKQSGVGLSYAEPGRTYNLTLQLCLDLGRWTLELVDRVER